MLCNSSLTTAQVLAVFADEIGACQGEVTDTFDDGQRLFTRSILPSVEEVRRGDKLQGGVALKGTAQGIWLYPYVFRLVCRNGAITAEALESRSLMDVNACEPDAALQSVREGVQACCAPEVFADSVRKMRTACETEADLVLTLLPLVSRHFGNAELVSQIMDRFFRERDHSRFGLANAVTALARDTRDPELRWDLEEFGGGIAVGMVPAGPADAGRNAMGRVRELMAVG
jgi:hypothetical protein